MSDTLMIPRTEYLDLKAEIERLKADLESAGGMIWRRGETIWQLKTKIQRLKAARIRDLDLTKRLADALAHDHKTSVICSHGPECKTCQLIVEAGDT